MNHTLKDIKNFIQRKLSNISLLKNNYIHTAMAWSDYLRQLARDTAYSMG